MPELKPVVDSKANIKVVGVGGGGCNVINTMISLGQIKGVDFIAVNTDEQALNKSQALLKLAIGKNITGGLGAGAKPDIGEKAAIESESDIRNCLDGADMVFISAGMGGGTGTGAAPIIAKISKSLGALTIGVVTKPFSFEGKRRSENAELGIERMRAEVDALIVVPNEKLLEYAKEELTMEEALDVSDSVLSQGVQGISDLIVVPGEINVDFADVETVMKNAGTAMMGIGIGSGENRAEMAAKSAISSPLLDVKIEGAKGVLVNIVGGGDMKMSEYAKAANIITEGVSPEANIIFGYIKDPNNDGQIKITVIATDFDSNTYSSYSKNNINLYNTRPNSSYETPKKYSRDAYDNDLEIETVKLPDFEDEEVSEYSNDDNYENTYQSLNRREIETRSDFRKGSIKNDAIIQRMDEDVKSIHNLIEDTDDLNEVVNESPTTYKVNNPFLRNGANSNFNQMSSQQRQSQNNNSDFYSSESKNNKTPQIEDKDDDDSNDYLIPPFLRRKK